MPARSRHSNCVQPLERELEFVAIPDLEDEDLVARVAEMRERLEELGHVAEAIAR